MRFVTQAALDGPSAGTDEHKGGEENANEENEVAYDSAARGRDEDRMSSGERSRMLNAWDPRTVRPRSRTHMPVIRTCEPRGTGFMGGRERLEVPLGMAIDRGKEVAIGDDDVFVLSGLAEGHQQASFDRDQFQSARPAASSSFEVTGTGRMGERRYA